MIPPEVYGTNHHASIMTFEIQPSEDKKLFIKCHIIICLSEGLSAFLNGGSLNSWLLFLLGLHVRPVRPRVRADITDMALQTFQSSSEVKIGSEVFCRGRP